jgi:hypothetical protein
MSDAMSAVPSSDAGRLSHVASVPIATECKSWTYSALAVEPLFLIGQTLQLPNFFTKDSKLSEDTPQEPVPFGMQLA